MGKFFKTFREELEYILLKHAKIFKKRKDSQTHYEASNILIQKPDRETTKNKNTVQYADEHTHYNPQDNIGNPHTATH